MFEDRVTSLGALNQDDQLMVRAFLHGSSWAEQWELMDDESGMTPPDWLMKWSNGWRHNPILTISGDDWWMCEYLLVFDNLSHEAWIMIYQCVGGDDGVVFERVATDLGTPTVNDVCDVVLRDLESLGDSPLRGAFTIGSPQWLPQDRMAAFLVRALTKYGVNTVAGLALDQWLLREYKKRDPLKLSTEARDD
jgi:hypothetical protein